VESTEVLRLQTSSEYLTLALDVRRLTDSLVRIVEDGTQPVDLNASIQRVVISLQGTGKTSIKSLRERGDLAGMRASEQSTRSSAKGTPRVRWEVKNAD